MRFASGMAGVVVAVIAMMGTVVSGFALAVDTYEEETVEWDYVANISGLFEYSDVPYFIEYSPAANWTSWKLEGTDYTSGVVYSAASQANTYTITQETYVVSSGSLDLDSYYFVNPWYSQLKYYASTFLLTDGEVSAANPSALPDGYVVTNTGTALSLEYFMGHSVATLYDLIFGSEDDSWEGTGTTYTSSDGSVDTASSIRVDLNGVVAVPYSAWTTISTVLGSTTFTTWYASLSTWSAAEYILYDVASQIATLYDADGNIVGDTAYLASNITLVYNAEGTGEYDGDAIGSEVSWSMLDVSSDAIYMDISAGVTLDTDNLVDTVWCNEYVNSAASILFVQPSSSGSYSNAISVPLLDLDGTSTGSTLYIVVESSEGSVTVSLSCDGVTVSYNVGHWSAFMLTFDVYNGVYSVSTIDFNSFRDYDVYTTVELDFDVGSGATFQTMAWEPTNSSFTFGVVGTSVFMDTYNAVLIDPSLDITSWFPEQQYYRIDMYSFALWGDSLTVNGQTYEVSEGDIQVLLEDEDGVVTETWYDLNNVSFLYYGGHCYIVFNSDGVTVDTGLITTYSISMDGVWYMSTALYSGTSAMETVYDWNWQNYIFDSDASIVCFIGILALGTILMARFHGVSAFDLIVVLACAVAAFFLLGVF